MRRVLTAEASCSERCRPQTQSPKRPQTSTLYAVQLLGAFISSFIFALCASIWLCASICGVWKGAVSNWRARDGDFGGLIDCP